MARIALYRKYRPQDFSEVSGQEHIMKTLQNAVKTSGFSHAYIFCGPRGTGKTSVARIMAKAVNCQKQKDGNPCNKCAHCISISNQTALDIIEIDAASNRGIDEIRDLREKVKFTPSKLKFKVFIIDEVHMLTKEAFNALLKTLEEPPEHALFIMATTEIHKIPATVISRCQRFDFKRIGRKELERGLSEIAKKEKIKIQKEAIITIARVSEGGFRDAISILDQISMNVKGNISNTDVIDLLGIIDGGKIEKIAKMIEADNKKEALEFLNSLLQKGADIAQLTRGLMALYREKIKDTLEDNGLAGEYVYAIETLSECNRNFKHALYPQLSLEIAIIKIINTFSKEEKALENNNIEIKKEKIKVKKPEDTKEKAEGKETNKNSREIKWDQVLFEIKSKNNSIHAMIRESEPVFMDDEIHLIFPYKFHKERIEDRKNREIVEEAISKVCGHGYNIICKLGQIKSRQDSKPDSAKENESKLNKKENMDDILDVLGGEVVD